MGDSKKALKDEMAVMHTNCGTYCNPEAENEEGTFTLYRCVNCRRAFMVGEFIDGPANSDQPTGEEQPDVEQPEGQPDVGSQPEQPTRQKKTSKKS